MVSRVSCTATAPKPPHQKENEANSSSSSHSPPTMPSSSRLPLFLLLAFFLLSAILSIHPAQCDEEDKLLQGINDYRRSLNLTALTKNDNADCLAGEIADQFEGQPCTNTSGSNTVPGTEPQLPNYPRLLDKCHLNVSNTRDGAVMPACIPNLDPTLVLSNFTLSQYSDNLNDTKYTGVGIGSEGNWIVVVLSTNTPEGSFVKASSDNVSAGSVTAASLVSPMLLLLLVACLLLL